MATTRRPTRAEIAIYGNTAGIVGNRYAPGQGNVAIAPPMAPLYGQQPQQPSFDQQPQQPSFDQQQLLMRQQQQEQMAPLLMQQQQERERRAQEAALAQARMAQDWATGGRQLEFQSGQAQMDRMLREAMQDQQFRHMAEQAALGRGHDITMADVQDALARRRMHEQHELGLESLGYQQEFTSGENQLNRIQQERLQSLGHGQTLTRDQLLANLQADADARRHGQTLERDQIGFGHQRDMLDLGHGYSLERMDHGQDLSERGQTFAHGLNRDAQGHSVEHNFLLMQEAELQQKLSSIAPIAERLTDAGREKWGEIEAQLEEINNQHRGKKITDQERLRARSAVLEYFDQHPWNDWVQPQGRMPGDVVNEHGAMWRINEDGKRTWARFDPDADVEEFDRMYRREVRREDGSLIGWYTPSSRDPGFEFVPAEPGEGQSAAGGGMMQYFGDQRNLMSASHDVQAELQSRGWYATPTLSKFALLEKAEAMGQPVDYSAHLSPTEAQEVLRNQAHSIRQAIIAQLSDYQPVDRDGNPMGKPVPGQPVSLGHSVIQPVQVGLFADSSVFPDEMLLAYNQRSQWVQPLSPGVFQAAQGRSQGQGQQPSPAGQPQPSNVFQSIGGALGGIVGGMSGGAGAGQLAAPTQQPGPRTQEPAVKPPPVPYGQAPMPAAAPAAPAAAAPAAAPVEPARPAPSTPQAQRAGAAPRRSGSLSHSDQLRQHLAQSRSQPAASQGQPPISRGPVQGPPTLSMTFQAVDLKGEFNEIHAPAMYALKQAGVTAIDSFPDVGTQALEQRGFTVRDSLPIMVRGERIPVARSKADMERLEEIVPSNSSFWLIDEEGKIAARIPGKADPPRRRGGQ